MRTTLTLDGDIAARLRREMRRTGRSMKAIVNEALRLGLARFTVEARDLGIRPGIDPDRMNQLIDELQIVETWRTLRPR